MTAITHSTPKFTLNKEAAKAIVFWMLVAIAAFVLFVGISQAAGTGGGTSMDELNTWLESELGGSVGTTVGLLAFFSGLIWAVSTRAFMPLIWGMGIGITLGIFLDVVVTANSVGLPIATTITAATIG